MQALRCSDPRADQPPGRAAAARAALRALRGLARAAAVAAAAWVPALAHGHALDELTVRAAGRDALVRVGFTGAVRLVRQVPGGAARVFRIELEAVGAPARRSGPDGNGLRRVGAQAGAPELVVSLAPAAGRGRRVLAVELGAVRALVARQGGDGRSIELLVAAAAATTARPFAVSLQVVPKSQPQLQRPVPPRFQELEVTSVDTLRDGEPAFEVLLGRFATVAEAEAVRQQALDRFPGARVVDLARRAATQEQAPVATPAAARGAAAPGGALPATVPPAAPAPPAGVGEAGQPAAATAPAAVAGAPPTGVATAGAADEVERRASDLLARSRAALTAGRHELALDSLGQLLRLPPNAASREAQELVGVAWERAADPRRARAEYELYLRLYPEGEGSDRVRQRLAALPGGPAAPAGAGATTGARAPAAPPAERFRLQGSIAQAYYGGVARSESLVSLAPGIDQSTLSRTSESALITRLDLGATYLAPSSETRAVLRGAGALNLREDAVDASQLTAAYVDHRRNASGVQLRLGRQAAVGMGVLGLFDGVALAVPLRAGWRVGALGGAPARTLVGAPRARVLGALVEFDALLRRWGGSIYVLQQTSEGILDRRAAGTELRYTGTRLATYALLDYDLSYRALNVLSLHGTLELATRSVLTVLVDQRKAPSLQTTNALISSGATSLKTLLQLQSLAEVRAAARQTSADARQALVGLSRPLSARWQLAADLRYTSIGALPAVGNFEATPATGDQYAATLQLTGSNLYSLRDVNGLQLTVLRAPTFDGVQFGLSQLIGLLGDTLTLEPSLRWYRQADTLGVRLHRITPALRAAWRAGRRTSLLGETLVERTRTEGPGGQDTTLASFFYLGYRYELP